MKVNYGRLRALSLFETSIRDAAVQPSTSPRSTSVSEGEVYFNPSGYNWLARTRKAFLAYTRKPWCHGVVSRITCVSKGSNVLKVGFLARRRSGGVLGGGWRSLFDRRPRKMPEMRNHGRWLPMARWPLNRHHATLMLSPVLFERRPRSLLIAHFPSISALPRPLDRM